MTELSCPVIGETANGDRLRMTNALDRIRQLAGERLMVLASSIGAEREFRVAPLMFYHCRRTGGMTFFYALQKALDGMFAAMGHADPPSVARLELDSFGRAGAKGRKFSFIATHSPYGFHERFEHGFNFTTILRDPVARISSLYSYQCMRSGRSPSPSDFEQFLDLPDNHNEAVKQLSGLALSDDVDERSLALAKSNLTDVFQSYVSTSEISDLIVAYLSAMGLPNIIMARANQTLNRYRFDTAPYRAQIQSLNQLDQNLYSFVTANGRLPETDARNQISPLTIVIDEVEREAQSATAGIALPTQTILEFADTHPECLDDLGLFWELAGRSRR